MPDTLEKPAKLPVSVVRLTDSETTTLSGLEAAIKKRGTDILAAMEEIETLSQRITELQQSLTTLNSQRVADRRRLRTLMAEKISASDITVPEGATVRFDRAQKAILVEVSAEQE